MNMEMKDSTTGTPLNIAKLTIGMNAKPKHSHCTGFHFFFFFCSMDAPPLSGAVLPLPSAVYFSANIIIGSP